MKSAPPLKHPLRFSRGGLRRRVHETAVGRRDHEDRVRPICQQDEGSAPRHQPGMRSCAGWGQKCPADETYPNCVNGLPYLRDKDSLPTDSVQFALTETRSSILDTTEPIPESVHQRIIAQDVE